MGERERERESEEGGGAEGVGVKRNITSRIMIKQNKT